MSLLPILPALTVIQLTVSCCRLSQCKKRTSVLETPQDLPLFFPVSAAVLLPSLRTDSWKFLEEGLLYSDYIHCVAKLSV